MVVAKELNCMYCGARTRRGRKGEHIVPEAIGGALTLNDRGVNVVCQKCNNGALSEIDRELCSRSYLSVVASQEIDSHLWQVWDVAHSANNLLVEARPHWEDGLLSQLVCYPQIMFEPEGESIIGDLEEIGSIGYEGLEKVLVKAARGAFLRYRAGVKGSIHFERVHSQLMERGYRLPPRVFARRSVAEIANNIDDQSFILRFTDERDKRWALKSLDSLGKRPFKTRKPVLGSHGPMISVYFDMGQTVRALFKVGVNLLGAFCTDTPVNPRTFRAVVDLILGRVQAAPWLSGNGFVPADDIAPLNCQSGSHAFRLVYLSGRWLVYASFFGGRIGAAVSFPGPNRESWNTADITAPMGGKDWTFRASPIIQPLRVHVEWNNSGKLCPSLKFESAQGKIYVEAVKPRAPRR